MKGAISKLALLAATVAALPVSDIEERQVSNAKKPKTQAITDAQILNYALTLEHLEDTFYKQGLQNFTQAQFAAAGYDATFYKNLQEISSDEATHVSFLTSALSGAGASPVAACTYNFGVTSVQSFIATANLLEGVGVSAYLGAAQNITNKAYLTAAGAILTVEARHSAYLRASETPEGTLSPFPSPFDTPLDFDEVYSLASQFIASCPSSNAPLPVKAFPILSLTGSAAPTNGTSSNAKAAGIVPVATGSTITLSLAKGAFSGQVQVAWITVTGPIFADATIVNGGKSITSVVPSGIAGQSYVVALPCGQTIVTDDNILAGPAIVEVSD